MHVSTDISHWICALAGLYLVLTGLVLRQIMNEDSPNTALPASRRIRTRRSYGSIAHRTVMVVVGLLAMAYGVSRLF